MSFLPLLRPDLIKELVTRSTIGHYKTRKKEYVIKPSLIMLYE